MINIIIGFLIFIIVWFVFSIPFSMIILSLLFGIPKTIKRKKEKILSEKASIKPYLITALIWIPICIVIIILLFKFLPSYGGYSVWGLSLAMLKAFNCLNHRYYNTNMQDLLRIQADYIL